MTACHRVGTDPKFTIEEAAGLLCMPERTLRHQCDTGKFIAAHKDASGAWHIPLSSLPPLAQAKYWAQNMSVAPGGWREEDRRELPEEEAEALWKFFENATAKLKQQAYKDAEACHAWQIMKAQGIHYQAALVEIKQEFGLSKSTLYDKIARIKGYDPQHWPALLVGQWAGENVRRAAWHEGAWQFFIRNALTPGCKIKTAWSRTKRQADKEGWGVIPSYDTAKNDYKKIPHDVLTLLKEGETALKVKSPTAIRDYNFPLHTTWSMDGRRMDLMVIDTKGKYGPAGRKFRLWVYAFQEVRSRMLLGYALGSSLDADLVRGAFLNALKTTGRLIPRKIQSDNGMETAAKEHTGGAPWRRRGKVLDDEIIGTFPLLGIEVDWASVAHGQAKPVERLFRTLAQMIETQPDFRGAYCGDSTGNKPEEFDADKPIPVERVEQVIDEENAAYHRTPHSGHGMDGKSPLQVYTEQLNKPGVAFRKITEAQLRLCAYSAVAITIRKNGTFTIMGASYWSEGTAKLAPGKGYYARFNQHNLSDPVYVYRKENRLCEAARTELTAFNDKAAGKAIMKKRAAYTKAVKQQAKALQDLSNSDSRDYLNALAAEVLPEMVDKETGEILPTAQVLEIVKGRADPLQARKTAEDLENDAIRKEAKQMREKESMESAERVRQRARGGISK
ncbi:MAG TPA: transposase domain-containing protein [Sulfuriferula sp.]|nr:transposase domain-containing protein [Sulfuriferula sp.]